MFRYCFSVLIVALCLGQFQNAFADKHALLVGCSKYPAGGFRELAGAENDAKGFERLLRERFRFDDVTALVGWPDDPLKRPTYGNICAEFERLIREAKPDSQVVILMAGHGFRFPLPETQIDVLDPANPEPDGKDEAFLAADYRAGKNMILDNQIGQWLDQLKEKGAHVWIVFDSCFSGTMTRGTTQENIREISAAEAGVSMSAIKSAEQRALSARKETVGSSQSDVLDMANSGPSIGSVVAFYAAQDFETAPEVTRPRGEDSSDVRFKHGLLSYHLERLLRDRTEQVTYADLGRALVSQYRADGRRRPTPTWEGDIDREVLGLRRWPAMDPIRVEHVDGATRLSGGELSGLTVDTVVAVYEPTDKEFTTPLGHLRITEATSTSALVEAVAFGNLESKNPESLPDNAVCRIVSRPLGDTRIKLKLALADPELAKAIREAGGDQDGVFQLVEETPDAEWTFASVPTAILNSADKAGRSAAVLLPASEAGRLAEPIGADTRVETLLARIPHVLIRNETLKDPSATANQLQDELQKVFVWNNVWRLAGEYAESSPLVSRQDLQLDIRKLEGADDRSDGDPLTHSQLVPGDSILLRVVNRGYERYWYVVFYLNGRYDIQHVETRAIRGRNFRNAAEKQVARDVLRFQVDDRSIGSNGFVLIAVSTEQHANQPDYRHLTQAGLGKPAKRGIVNTAALRTPFERLLLDSIGGRQRFRSSLKSLDNPQIASWSWVTQRPE